MKNPTNWTKERYRKSAIHSTAIKDTETFRGKRIAIAMSYADADPFSSGCVNALRAFQDAFNYTGSTIVGMVYGSADKPGEIKSNKVLMKQAEALGKKLAAG